MAAALPLRAALKRGALLTLANWPTVVIEFAIESLYKLALGVPIVGGAVMVAVVLGADLRGLLAEGVRSAADAILGSLAAAPDALVAFLAAVGIVAFGGALLMYAIKAGTLAILVEADRRAGEIERPPVRFEILPRASAYALPRLLAASQRFARRAALLVILLSAAYAAIAVLAIGFLTVGFEASSGSRWAPLWPLIVVAATSTGIIAVSGVNLMYDLLRIVVITDDCGVRAALGRVRRFLIEDARQVVGIFAVMTAVQMLATAAALTLTAGLTTVAFVPLAGLIVVPLQLAAWLLRGLVFQGLSLTAICAYQTQYRRSTDLQRELATPFLVHHA